MDVEAFVRAVAAVDWSALHGAYGPSDGSAEYGASDVATALLVLAREPDCHGDDWMDALDVVLGHVWHQGSVYPVTPHAFPLVLWLADELPAPNCVELAQTIAVFVRSAVACVDHPEDGFIGRRILELAREHAHVVLGWTTDARGESAAAIVIEMPELLPRYLEVIECSALGPFELLVLASLPQPPAWALERAREALFADHEPTAIAAAILVAREGPDSRKIAERLDEVLRPGAEARLRGVIGLDLPIPALPRGPFTGFGGEILEAQALFVGASVVTLRIGGTRNLTLRWVPDGLAKGAKVHVGMTTSGRPCWIEWTNAVGKRERVGLSAELTRGR